METEEMKDGVFVNIEQCKKCKKPIHKPHNFYNHLECDCQCKKDLSSN